MTYVGQSASAAQQPTADRATVKDVVGAYVGLTKPRVIELLLLTTVPVMFFAAQGVPDLGLVVATVFGGTFSAGSASVFNCVYDRDIDEQMRRTRRRALPRHIVSPRSALVFGFALGIAVDGDPLRVGQPAVGPAVGDGHRVLRLRLHHAAQAAHHPEHRLGRPGGLLPHADRLDRRHRLARLDAGGAVHGGLLLDPTPHLGARAALPRGLRQRRRPDAPGRRTGPRGRQADRDLQLGDGRDLPAAVAGRRHRHLLPDRRGRPGRRLPGRGPPDVGPHQGHREPGGDPADAAVPRLQPLPVAALRRRRALAAAVARSAVTFGRGHRLVPGRRLSRARGCGAAVVPFFSAPQAPAPGAAPT